jgi:hypothetical protein
MKHRIQFLRRRREFITLLGGRMAACGARAAAVDAGDRIPPSLLG